MDIDRQFGRQFSKQIRDLTRVTPRLILHRDQSSSMILVPEFPELWNAQLSSLSHLLPDMRVTIYSVTAEVHKLQDDVPIGEVKAINKRKWHYGAGGMLKGGSALGDAVIRGCQKAQQFRGRGEEGKIGFFLFTDGWSRQDQQPLEKAKKWLTHARTSLGVHFRLFGFTNQQSKPYIEMFCETLGITEEENQTVFCEGSIPLVDAARDSLIRMGEVSTTLLVKNPNHPLNK